MKKDYTFKIWRLEVTINVDLFDLDPTDGQIGIGAKIYFSWK